MEKISIDRELSLKGRQRRAGTTTNAKMAADGGDGNAVVAGAVGVDHENERRKAHRHYDLMMAANGGDGDAVVRLITAGVDPHAGDENTLRAACQAGHLAVVQLLVLSYRADVHAGNDVEYGSEAFTLEDYVPPGRWVDVQDEGALVVAIDHYRDDVARWLVTEGGADVHACADEAVRLAAWRPNPDDGFVLGRWLITECGADAHAVDDNVARILAQRGWVDDIRWLVGQESGVEWTGASLRALADDVAAAPPDRGVAAAQCEEAAGVLRAAAAVATEK